MSDSKSEDTGFVLNLSEDRDKKKKNDKVNIESPDVKTNSSFIEDSDTSPSYAFKLKNKSKFVKKQTLFSKSHNTFPKSIDAKQKLGHDNLHFSSIFKSNPEIPHLNVCKQKAKAEPLFSTKTFDDLDLHPHLVSCLKSRLEAVRLTKVQESSIPILLQGQDALIKSCTGSGKTLAYAVPIVQKLREMNPKVQRSDGVYALIIVPTRELALQCFECFSKLTKAFTWIVPGYLIGGEKKKSEKARLRKGINILISTPGRLLDHMERTSCLSLSKILWLVIDEADKLLEQGFEEAVTKIISQCNKDRHSILLSATLSKGVENLAGMSLSDPVHIDVGTSAGKESGEFENLVVPNNLKQYVVIVPSKLRLAVISGFIIDNCVKGGFKALIFMCSQGSVNFHYSLFSGVLATLLQAREKKCKFYRLHGNMKQEERTEIFNSFKSAKEGVLLCTDVAARGLDLLHVDWIVQYSAPSSAEIYVHRVGRTARIGKKGNSLLFLLPSESNFAHLLEQHKISYDEILASKFLQSILLVNEVLSPKSKTTAEECATALHTKYENEVYSESILHDEAKEAFASYVQSYASYPKNIRHILPFKALHLGHVAKSFCLREAPSALGCNIPNAERPKQRKLSTKPQKRKMQVVISEYDSGLSALTHDFGRKPKRKKS